MKIEKRKLGREETLIGLDPHKKEGEPNFMKVYL